MFTMAQVMQMMSQTGLNQPTCNFCGGPHFSANCNSGGMFTSSTPSYFTHHEEVDYVGNAPRQQNNPYSNTYNPGWQNHPNFGWSNNTNQGPSGFQRPYSQ